MLWPAVKMTDMVIGLDFHALSVTALEAQLAGERRASETLRAQLDTAIRTTVRPSAAS